MGGSVLHIYINFYGYRVLVVSNHLIDKMLSLGESQLFIRDSDYIVYDA